MAVAAGLFFHLGNSTLWPLPSPSGSDKSWEMDIGKVSKAHAAFRAYWRIPPLAVRLAKHRLLFLPQLQKHGTQVVWDFVTAKDQLCSSAWLNAQRGSMQFAML